MDKISRATRSRIMSRIKSVNTSPEMAFRKIMFSNGLRGFRLHYPIKGKPDIVFPRKKLAIFIDGDFWHGYNWKVLGKSPPRKYWQAKIKKNMKRDKEITLLFKKEKWKVIRFWEHDIKKKPEKCVLKVKKALQ